MAGCVHSRTDIRKDMPAIRNFHDACGRLGVGAVVVLATQTITHVSVLHRPLVLV